MRIGIFLDLLKPIFEVILSNIHEFIPFYGPDGFIESHLIIVNIMRNFMLKYVLLSSENVRIHNNNMQIVLRSEKTLMPIQNNNDT